jgi:hypothetical protein
MLSELHFNSDVFCLQLSCCIYALNFCIHLLMPHWLGLCVLRMTCRQNRLHETFFHTVIILSKHHHHHHHNSSVTLRITLRLCYATYIYIYIHSMYNGFVEAVEQEKMVRYMYLRTYVNVC